MKTSHSEATRRRLLLRNVKIKLIPNQRFLKLAIVKKINVPQTPGLLKALAILSYTSAGRSAIELQDKKKHFSF